MAEDPDQGLEGRILGDEYVIVGPLPGQRPQPALFEGRHLRLGYRVVVRVSPRQPASPVTTEVDALARVRHAAIPMLLAHVIDAEGSREYLIREFAQGQPLGVLLRSHRRFETLRAVHVTRQILAAVSELHRSGIVHGDLKPENIIVDDADGDRVRLIDFASSTIDGVCHDRRGTPRYLAPELLGGGATPTVASDVFAVGCVLREALMGEPPSGDDAGESLTSISGSRTVSSQDFAERLLSPPALRAVLERATSKDPSMRFTSAMEFSDALGRLDERALAATYLGTFPPSARVDQETMDLSSSSATLPASRSYTHDLPELRSVGKPSVWVMTGAPSIAQVVVQTALAQIARDVDLRFLDEKSRATIRADLQQGRVSPPWVLVFGDLHALLGDSLLSDFSSEGETMRVLVSSHANLELTQATINTTGLDWQICLPCSVKEIMAAILEMVERSARRRRYYDGLRVAVVDAIEQREELSRQSELKGMH